MKKFENIQLSKLTTSYGGVGSIIETKGNGSIIVLPFDEWPFYGYCVKVLIRNDHKQTILKTEKDFLEIAKKSLIKDERLIKRLHDLKFEKLRGIFMPPSIDSNGYGIDKDDLTKLLMSDYFPKWFYCPKCRKLAHLNEWRGKWNNQFPNAQNRKVFDQNPPSCFSCSSPARNHGFRRKYLEQVRFVLASMDNGQTVDLPWHDLLHSINLIQHYGLHQEFRFSTSEAVQTDTSISYRTSRYTDNLYGIHIQTSEAHLNMGQLERIDYVDQSGNAYRMMIRNSPNLCFTETESSIYIPIFIPTLQEAETLKRINESLPHEKKNIPEALFEKYRENAMLNGLRIIPEDIIKQLIIHNFNPDDFLNFAKIEDFIRFEFEYITNPANYDNKNICQSDDFIAEKILSDENFLAAARLDAVYCIHRLKQTEVQISYSRIDYSKNGKEWYDPISHTMKEKLSAEVPTCSIEKGDIEYLPGIQNFGEGMFFEFSKNKFLGSNIEIVLHTFCHIIMKELEFECGYPLTSLKERLYFLEDNEKCGFLIYSINGSESSYGGIVSLFPKKIEDIVLNSMERAKDCPNDPICESEGGTCFACTDLPETSCEIFNEKLGRTSFLSAFYPAGMD